MRILLLMVLLFVTIVPTTICEEYEYIVLTERWEYPNSHWGDYRGEKILIAKRYNTLDEVLKNAATSQKIYRVSKTNIILLEEQEYQETVTMAKKRWVVLPQEGTIHVVSGDE